MAEPNSNSSTPVMEPSVAENLECASGIMTPGINLRITTGFTNLMDLVEKEGGDTTPIAKPAGHLPKLYNSMSEAAMPFGRRTFIKAVHRMHTDNPKITLVPHSAGIDMSTVDPLPTQHERSETAGSSKTNASRVLKNMLTTIKTLLAEGNSLMDLILKNALTVREDFKQPPDMTISRIVLDCDAVSVRNSAEFYTWFDIHLDMVLLKFDLIHTFEPVNNGVQYFLRDTITHDLRRRNIIKRTFKFHSQSGLGTNNVK